MSTDTLRPDLIVKTISRLHHRIGERFPNSGLVKVCHQVLVLSQNMETRADWIGRPVKWMRVVTWIVIAAIIVLAVIPFGLVGNVPPDDLLPEGNLKEVLELIESGINDLVLIGAAIFFLLTIENRYKRQRALAAMHELRSLAHVIDMHQLTKDPHRIMRVGGYPSTDQSPKLEMSRFELHRYLDYCSEMLALIGKLAAVYVQEFDDSVAMAAASELETLTTGLSRKIWQKIAILSTVENEYETDQSSVDLPGKSVVGDDASNRLAGDSQGAD